MVLNDQYTNVIQIDNPPASVIYLVEDSGSFSKILEPSRMFARNPEGVTCAAGCVINSRILVLVSRVSQFYFILNIFLTVPLFSYMRAFL